MKLRLIERSLVRQTVKLDPPGSRPDSQRLGGLILKAAERRSAAGNRIPPARSTLPPRLPPQAESAPCGVVMRCETHLTQLPSAEKPPGDALQCARALKPIWCSTPGLSDHV